MVRYATIAPQSRTRLSWLQLCFIAVLFFALKGGYASAQQSSPNQADAPPPAAAPTQTEAKKIPETAATPTAPAVTDPHQAQIVADTQKLLKLSQELKAEVAKSNKDTLSLTVIKKAEEVEKLANPEGRAE
jgi:hypothetical protein